GDVTTPTGVVLERVQAHSHVVAPTDVVQQCVCADRGVTHANRVVLQCIPPDRGIILAGGVRRKRIIAKGRVIDARGTPAGSGPVKGIYCSRQIVAYDIQIDAFRRSRRNIVVLSRAAERVLHIRICLGTGGTKPITVISAQFLIEAHNVSLSAIDRKVAGAGGGKVSHIQTGPTEKVLGTIVTAGIDVGT